MSKNPFLPFGGKRRPEKRNSLDLSRSSLFTTDWGKLYPFFCQEVIPGDSFKIDASVGFRAMQTKFPLQSRIRMSCSFFYVRNKNLFDKWEDFIFSTKTEQDGVVAPWLRVPQNSERSRMFATGGLGDALGMPTTKGTSASMIMHHSYRAFFGVRAAETQSSWSSTTLYNHLLSRLGNTINLDIFPINGSVSEVGNYYGYLSFFPVPLDFSTLNSFTLTHTGNLTTQSFQMPFVITSGADIDAVILYVEKLNCTTSSDGHSFNAQFTSTFVDKVLELKAHVNDLSLGFATVNSNGSPVSFNQRADFSEILYIGSEILPPSDSPFIGLTPQVPINALPFRAYEQICNYYFRNDLNSPYMLNGEAQYNEFIPTHAGGADDNFYDFHFHNWELDRFVSALQSPQFGEAPLVGLNYRVGADNDVAKFTFEADGQQYTADLAVDTDTMQLKKIVGFSEDLPASNLRKLMQMVDAGFSINALRDVNSFQRFKENCLRRGLRYRNQMKSHFGVSVDYPDIDVPEYIGGFSSWAEVGQVTNMAEMPDSGLGDYIGTLRGLAESKHSIHHYCAEHGFIIGLFCVYPVPVYSQAIEKYLLKTSPFDYFQTEFGKIGFAPIHYSEVSPLQTDANHQLTDVFGYQKAWYDYMSAFDSAHGDFRTSFRDFLIQRLWDAPPVLSEDFVRVNPVQLNDVFTTRNIADVYNSSARFLCSSSCKVTALRPIPIHGMPSLE